MNPAVNKYLSEVADSLAPTIPVSWMTEGTDEERTQAYFESICDAVYEFTGQKPEDIEEFVSNAFVAHANSLTESSDEELAEGACLEEALRDDLAGAIITVALRKWGMKGE